MKEREYLTEDEVILGAENFLCQKGRTDVHFTKNKASAAKKEHGVDLKYTLGNQAGNCNKYFIEAKGNARKNGTPMRSKPGTNFKWALSQIILRIKVDSTKYNYIYGIAMPKCDIENCIRLIRDNWALKYLKIRLYGVYRSENGLTAKEYLPKEIYTGVRSRTKVR